MALCIKGKGPSAWHNCFSGMQQENKDWYTKEGVKQELEKCIELSDVVNNKLFWEMEEGNDVIRWTASPVLMAIFIGEYDLAKQLIEKGYPTVVVDDAGNIMELKGSVQHQYRDRRIISLGQFLLGAPKMPDEFRVYLWRCIAKEKHIWSKKLQKPRGKVIDFSMISQENYGQTMFELVNSIDLVLGYFKKQTVKSLIYIAEHYPKYLRNAINEDWEHVLADDVFEEVEDLVKILLDQVITRDKVRLRLIKVISKSSMDSSDNIFQHARGFEDKAIHMFKTLFPYYKTSEAGKRLLRIFMIRWFRETYMQIERDVKCMFEKDNEIFFFKMFKSILSPEYTFNQCAKEYIESGSLLREFMNERLYGYQDLIHLFALYSNRLGYSICLGDDNDSFVEDILCQGGMDRVLKSVEIHAVMEWLSYVDGFCFKNQKYLALVQKMILKTQNYDFILKMLQKGFLKGGQIQLALEYCARKRELQKVVPCILSFEGGEVDYA